MEMIKVAADSRSTAVAGAIPRVIRGRGEVGGRGIGCRGVNQAGEGVGIGWRFLLAEGI